MILLENIDGDNYSQDYFLLRLFLVFLLSSLFNTIGCSTEILKKSGMLEHHAIIINKGGKPYLPIEPPNCMSNHIDSCDDSRHWSTQEKAAYLTNAYDEYLDELIISAEEHFEKRGGGKRQLLLFIHGGLNQQENSNDRASKLAKQIKEDTQGEYYPIFINWDSALLSSYGEHLVSVRQGKADRWAWATSPTYLATDLGRGLLRAPVVWWSLVGNDLVSTPSNKDNWFFNFFDLARDQRNANQIAESLKNGDQDKNFKFWFGRSAPYSVLQDWVLGITTTALTYPIKFAISPWIDALGKSAWENMLRRTDLLLHTESEFQTDPSQSKMVQEAMAPHQKTVEISDSHPKEFEARIRSCESLVRQKKGLTHVKSDGALSILFQKLAEKILSDNYKDWSITLVGHSMGAIITNHIIRDFGACLPLDNIVFMAAASTINNYKDSVFPFLKMRQEESRAQGTSMPNVYHLMLHELAETSETNYWNLPPTGSLLVWIDNFLSTPNTPMDRTSGRFINFMLSLHATPEEMRPYISIKRFPGGGSGWGGVGAGIPKNHSDFSGRFRFWKEECWKPPAWMTPQEMFDKEKEKNCFY